jgi:hypothetical protein
MLVRTLLRPVATTARVVPVVRALPIVYTHRTLSATASTTTTPAATTVTTPTEPIANDATTTVGTTRSKAKSRHSRIDSSTVCYS